MLRSYRLAATLSLLSVIFPLSAAAQTPIALPYTMTTFAGLTPMAATAGTQCPNLPAGVKSTDAYGDGCLAVNGIFGAAAYGGVQVDLNGMIYVVDDTSATPVIHKINPATGIMTMVAGGGAACSGKQDSSGDGCLATATALVNNRSAGIDYYGNILLGGYSDHLVHMICLNASPLCGGTVSATTPIEIPIGNMGLVAGCAASTTGNGTSSGTTVGTLGAENTPGFSYKTYSLSTFQNGGTCTTSLGEDYKPEGITGDVYGNIYYADSGVSRWRVVLGPASYKGITNPLYTVLLKNAAWTSVTAGYVYTISGYPSTTATTAGTSCGGTATDGFGDGCLFTSSYSMGLAGYPSGMGVDASGNMIYTDETRGLRVFYVSDGTNFAAGTPGYIAGQKMKNAIIVNIKNYAGWTTVTAPPTGYNYMLAGGGGTAIGTTTPATLGSALSFTADNKMYKLAVSPQGNIFIGDSNGPARVYFYDINTGYLRTLFVGSANVTAGNYCSGTSGPKSLSAYSDGCPASKSLFSDGNSMSVGVDPQGNLYMYDGTEPVIRKVLAQGFSPLTYNTTPTAITQTFQVHLPESATGTVSPATAAVTSSPDITVVSGTNPTTPSCSQNSDNTVDCTVQVTTAPTQVGQRSAALTVSLPTGSWENPSATINLGQTETGSVMVVDSATMGGTPIALATHAIFSSITPATVAVDGAGNVYAASGTSIQEAIGSAYTTSYTLTTSLPVTPSQIAVDPTGNIFAVNSGVATITELQLTAAGAPATYTKTSVSYTSSGTAAPQAIATDQYGNLYVADYQSSDASAVYRLSWSPLTQTYTNQVTVDNGLNNPVSLAVDSSGNVFIADKSAGKVYEYSPSSALTYSLANTYSVASPDAVAVDPGGDVYVQTGSSVVEIPVSGPETTVLTGLSSPAGLAVDGLGNVYSADASNTSITQVARNAASANFGASETTAYAATLTNAGNLVTASPYSTTLANIDLAAGSGTGCSVLNSLLSAMTAGQACTISAEMIGAYSTTSSGAMTASINILEFTPTASTIGSLQFSGTLPEGQVYSTTTTISGQTPASPIFSASGTEATFTVTVAATVPPTNNVYVTVDLITTEYALNSSGQATVNVTGLKACSTSNCHTISATYYTNGFYTGSTSGSTAFNVTQSTTSASWSPAATTQQVSAAIGTTGVLDAAAATADSSVTSIAGNFAYTATCTSTTCPASYPKGTAVGIDASTYLPIGTYTLTATFIPTDTTDYSSASSVQVTGYTVTQATTTASVGASTNVVASDGSGNYTSFTAALAALPVTGGTIYLKPGTYTGQNAISYPNVNLRGLGGDPTKILLTAANGNFAVGSYPQSSGTAFGPGPAGKGGDEGSAVLDVSKNGYPSGSYSPAGFYAEYLTLQNTYDTDTVTTSTTTASANGGTCIFNPSGTPHTLQYLYNNNVSCGSQAQALYMSADQAVLNNVNLISQQDTLYAGYQGTSGSTAVPARQYIWKGTITGSVDYIFGDAALVLDHTNIFTTWNGSTSGTAATNEATITAQNKRVPTTGGAGDYLSGYVCNACTLMSQSTGMTKLYYGRPWGVYSTFILLNSYVDQVNPAGWIGWDGVSEYLSTSTYAEYNTQAYTDPAVGTAPYPSILFYPTTGAGGIIPTGGNSGYGATASSTPAAALESYALQLTAGTAAPYYPVNFLSNPVSTTGGYSGMPTTWNPVTTLAARVNAFASTGTITTVASGSSVTILGRPQTPGAGFIPTGTYQFLDSVNGAAATVMTNGSGSLDASGEAYLTTSSLAAGTHMITFAFTTGDGNFASSTSTTPYIINVTGGTQQASTITVTPAANAIYGSSTSATITVAASSGTTVPTGTLLFWVDSGSAQTVTLTSAGTYTVTLPSLTAGTHTLHTVYQGDTNFLGNTATGYLVVARAVLQITASNILNVTVGSTIPASFGYTTSGYVNGDTSSVLSGAPIISTTATSPAVIGEYPITITTGTLAASNYTFAFTGGYLYVTGTTQAAPVATGDSRVVTEPSFPAVCQQLNADITQVNNDIPASVDTASTPLSNANLLNPTVTNPDGGRIQAALNACSASYPGSGPGLAVELSVDGAGNNAFLSGPLVMPSNVTLLVDPGVVLFFSRNAQDYDKVAGTHTCGTINTNSASSSCLNLVDIPKTSTNVGIMGYGKLDGRGGDPLINAISPYQGYSWWGLSAAYASPNSQQNPRWIQMESGSSNITLYKITLRNAPMFHVTTGGAVSNFTAWDIKIITPTTSRNTDGIDPGNVTNVTITRSWISDGDDNVAVGASGTTAPATNISVTNNHFFAGHGQSFGSYTGAGISNVLWDGNMAAGNGFAGATGSYGSSVSSTGTFLNGTADSNSTGIRIKSANDRGGLVTNIQYSNECLLDHKVDIQFTPYYSSGDSTNEFPNYKNILMQNIVFMNDDASTGTVEMTGEYNTNSGTPVINPLKITLDNVTFPTALASLVNSTTPVESASVWGNGNYSGGTGQYAALTYGPGEVSTNFITAYASLASVSANNDTVTNSITASSLNPPACTFTYIAPELTGPTGLPQTITQGQAATAVVILTPAVGGAAYPTGTVTLTDALTSSTYTTTLPGNTDTILIPLSGLSVGTHTFTATYSGDSNYTLTGSQTVYSTTSPYVITVNAGSLSSTTTALGLPVSTTVTSTYGTAVTATATVTGANPTGSVQFVVSGGGLSGSYSYATVALTSGTASTSINLPYNTTAYNITAVYNGDSVNAGSTSSVASLTVGAAVTITTLTSSAASAALGNPIILTATVTSAIGTPAAEPVTFAYATTLLGTQTTLGAATTNSNGVTTYYLNSLPVGSYYLFASYAGSGSYGLSTSTGVPITVTAATNIVQLSNAPIALPYIMTTIAGGGAAVPGSGNMVCTGATDKYGDGCQATAIAFTATDDMRAVSADPFGNVYLTDISATRVRRITPNGVITTFAGGGSTCTPPASTSALGSGCAPTAAALSKPRGVGSDAAGNVFISDYSGDKVYEVKAADGLMYLVAGTGTASSTGDGGPAASATVDAPRSAWDDSLGNIYIADTSANKVRVVDTLGNIHTFAGAGGTTSTGDGGPATAANLDNPQGVFVDPNLNVYVTDSLGKIRVICVTCGTSSPLDNLLQVLGATTTLNSATNGYIYTIAGNGSAAAYAGTYPILATSVSMAPQKLSMDNSGNLYISDSNGFVWFLDFHTGYIRAIAANGTICASKTDSLGDGCPATQASFGSGGGNGLGAGVDTQGNLYISDTTNGLIRKVTTGLAFPSTAVNATTTQSALIHVPTTAIALSWNPTSDWSMASPPPITQNSDNTGDLLVAISLTPKVPGLRSTSLTASNSGNTTYFGLTGIGSGAGATLDPAKQISFGTGLSVAGLATDNAGNVYVSDATSKKVLRFASSALTQGTSAASTTLATLTAPGAVAVDSRGYVYAADTSTGKITQITFAGTVSTLPFTFTAPAGLAVDALNNLYVSDSSAQAVYQINPITGVERNLNLGTLVTPKGLTIDPSGNLLVADPGAPAVYRYNFATGSRTTVTTTATAPKAVLTDAAGNLLIGDTAKILAVPASANSSTFTVASIAPSALAIDSAGNLYTGSGGGVLKLIRTQGYVQYAGPSAPSQALMMLESGNLALSATSLGQTDKTDYSLTATASTDCTVSAGLPTALALGGVCPLTASYTPTVVTTTTDTVTVNNALNAVLSTPASVQFVLTGPATTVTSGITITSFLPASPALGQPITVSATVTGNTSLEPTGTVAFYLDGSTTAASSGTVNGSGVATGTLTVLNVGSHSVTATYTSSNGYPTATTTVNKAEPSITLASSLNPILIQNPVTYTATVSSAAGLPTGTVAFSDGGTVITACASVTVTTATGLANCAVTYTVTGTHNITAVYSGDTNFLPAGPSNTVSEAAIDINLGTAVSGTGTSSETILPGGAATYSFPIAPSSGATFPLPVTFTVSSSPALPSGTTMTLAPSAWAYTSNNPWSWTLPANTALTGNTVLTIQLPQTTSSAQPAGGNLASRLAPFSLALLLLPFASGLRKSGKRMGRLLAIILLAGAGAATLAGLSGCGSNSGFFAQQQQSYTVNVTVSYGSLSHISTVTLTVE